MLKTNNEWLNGLLTLHDNERYGEVRGRSVHGWQTVG